MRSEEDHMNQEYEKEINIMDMLFYIVYRWRSIVLAAVIGVVLLIGYKMLSIINTSPQTVAEDVSEEVLDYEYELDVYNLTVANYDTQLASYKMQLEQLQEYIDSSIWLRIDPLSVFYSSADIYLSVPEGQLREIPGYDQRDVVVPLTQAYRTFVLNSVDFSELAKKNQVSEAMIRELVYASYDGYADTVNVKVIANTEQLAKDILDVILEQVKKQETVLSADIMEHDVKITNRSDGIDTDLSIMTSINDYNAQITSLQNNIYNVQKSKKELVEPEEPQEPVVSISEGLTAKTIIKYAIVGLALGIFLLVAIYGVAYIFSGSISTNAEIKEAFGYYMLGAFAPVSKRNGPIDKWLRKLAKVEARPDETIYQRVVANIQSLSESGQTLLLTGTVADELLEKVGDELTKRLPGYSILVSGNFVEDASVMAKLSQSEGVIILEQCRVSSFSQVEKEAETIRAVNKPVVGYIMM